MKWKIYLKAGIVIVLLFVPTRLPAEGLSVADNQVFADGYIDFRSAGPLAMVDYPFARCGRRMVFQTSLRQLYEIKELTDNRAGLGFRWNKIDGGVAAAFFGEGDYFQQIGLATFSNYTKGEFTLGLAGMYKRISFGSNYDNISWYLFNGGISRAYMNLLIFAVGRSLNQPALYPGSQRRPPQFETGLSHDSGNGLESQLKLLFERGRRPTAEVSQAFAITDFAVLDWALILRPVRFGAGLKLSKNHIEFDYNFSHHPVLGSTHSVSLSLF